MPLVAELDRTFFKHGGGVVYKRKDIFDIESGGLAADHLRASREPFSADAVPLGNAKKPETVAAKIETARETYEHEMETATGPYFDRAALSPVTGRVLCIAHLGHDDEDPELLGDEDEVSLLSRWWSLASEVADQEGSLIGFNISHFDLPFLTKRSWILDVTVPTWVRSRRYWSDTFVDLMDVWGLGSREFISLNSVARILGVEGKADDECTGATFAQHWANNREAAIKYAKQDVISTKQLAEKMGVI